MFTMAILDPFDPDKFRAFNKWPEQNHLWDMDKSETWDVCLEELGKC